MRFPWLALAAGFLLGGPVLSEEELGIERTFPARAESATRHGVAVVEARLLRTSRVEIATQTGAERVDGLVTVAGESVAVLLAPPGADVEAWSARVAERAQKMDLAPPRPVAGRPGRLRVGCPVSKESRLAALLMGHTRALPNLEFRIEVLPRARYLARTDRETPPRLESASRADWPWSGTEAEFDAFKREEILRWKAAKAAGRPYTPSRPALRLVPVRTHGAGEEPRSEEDAFRVVEDTPEVEAFGGSLLEDPVPYVDPQRGLPVVYFGVKTAFRERFGDWTERNRGLPLAILLEDTYRTAPVIQSRIEDSVQVVLGAGTPADLEKEAQELAALLAGPPLPSGTRVLVVARVSLTGEVQVSTPFEDEEEAVITLRVTAPGRRLETGGFVLRLPDVPDPVPLRIATLTALWAGGREMEQAALRATLEDAPEARTALEELAARGARPADRLLAYEILGGGDDPRGSWVLALRDPDLDVRLAATEALLKDATADPLVVPLLFAVAACGPEAARSKAREGLRGRVQRFPEAWTAAAASDDPALRVAAAESLFDAQDAWAYPLLLRAARDPEPKVRSAGVWTLARIIVEEGREVPATIRAELVATLTELVRTDAVGRNGATTALARLGDEGRLALEEIFRSGEAEARGAAIAGIASLSHPPVPEHLTLLRAALADPDERVRVTAAWYLSEIPAEEEAARQTAVAVAGDGAAHRDARLSAVFVLAVRLPDGERLEQALQPILEDPDLEVQGAAVLALSGAYPKRLDWRGRAEAVRRRGHPGLANFETGLASARKSLRAPR